MVAVCGVSFGPFIVAGQLSQVLLPFNSILGFFSSLSAAFQLPFTSLSTPCCLVFAPRSPCLLLLACVKSKLFGNMSTSAYN